MLRKLVKFTAHLSISYSSKLCSMTFSAREATLNNDEEWLNIPAVVRIFLRQLNNDVSNTHSLCEGFLKYQRDNDKILKDIICKQRENTDEMSKIVLLTQHRRQESTSSVCNTVNGIMSEVRELREENRRLRGRVHKLEKQKPSASTGQECSNTEAKALSKMMSRGFAELRGQISNDSSSVSRDINQLREEIALVSRKQLDLSSKYREDIQCVNAALRQLENSVFGEINAIKAQLQDHRKLLDAVNEDNTKVSAVVSMHDKNVSALNDRLDTMVSLVRDSGISTDDRFETIFTALRRLQALTGKLSTPPSQSTLAQRSLTSIIQEIRGAHDVMAVELRDAINQKFDEVTKETDQLNIKVDEMRRATGEVTRQLNHFGAPSGAKAKIEDAFRRLDALELVISKGYIREEVENLLEESMRHERAALDRKYQDLCSLISEQQMKARDDVGDVRHGLENLSNKFGSVLSDVNRSRHMDERLRSVIEKVGSHDSSITNLRDEVNAFKNIVGAYGSLAAMPSMDDLVHVGSATGKANCSAVQHLREMVMALTENQICELKLLVHGNQTKLVQHEAQLKEMFRLLVSCENVVEEHTNSYYRFVTSMDKKLSAALSNSAFLREQTVTLGAQSTSAYPFKEPSSPYGCVDEGKGADARPYNAQPPHSLLCVQEQAWATDSRFGSIQTVLNGFESNMKLMSQSVASVLDRVCANEEKLRRDSSDLRDEHEKLRSRFCMLEEKLNTLEGITSLNKKSSDMNASDILKLGASVETLHTETKKLEKAFLGCIRKASEEWSDVSASVAAFSTFLEKHKHERNAVLDKFAPIEGRLVICEEELSRLRSSWLGLTAQFEETRRSVENSTQFEPRPEGDCSVHQSSLLSLEQRIDCAEENLGAVHTLVSVHLNDALDFMKSCLGMLATAVDDIDTKLSAPPSLPMADGVSDQLDTLGGRLQRVENEVTELRGGGTIIASQPVGDTVLDRILSLERALTACSDGFMETKVSLSLCHEQIKYIEQHLKTGAVHHAVEEETTPVITDTPLAKDGNTTLGTVVERLVTAEAAVSEVQQGLLAQRNDLCALYTKSQLDIRFESLWASFVALLARKEDQEVIDEKMVDLQRSILEDVDVRVDTLRRELNCAIGERVRITEVRELLLGLMG